jgi:hypothetical protein
MVPNMHGQLPTSPRCVHHPKARSFDAAQLSARIGINTPRNPKPIEYDHTGGSHAVQKYEKLIQAGKVKSPRRMSSNGGTYESSMHLTHAYPVYVLCSLVHHESAA